VVFHFANPGFEGFWRMVSSRGEAVQWRSLQPSVSPVPSPQRPGDTSQGTPNPSWKVR